MCWNKRECFYKQIQIFELVKLLRVIAWCFIQHLFDFFLFILFGILILDFLSLFIDLILKTWQINFFIMFLIFLTFEWWVNAFGMQWLWIF